jgi:hypothetical protein
MDATFGAFKTNVDAVGKAGKRAVENWTALCSTTCCEPHAAGAKAADRSAK